MSIVHLHLLLNHLPVVGAFLGIALLAFALLRRNSEMGKFAFGLFALLAAVAVTVYFTGEPAEELVERLPGFSDAITERHEELAQLATIAMFGSGVLGLAALAVFRRRPLPRWVSAAGLVIALGIGGLMGATANLGGQIRHTEIRPGGLAGAGERAEQEEAEHRP